MSKKKRIGFVIQSYIGTNVNQVIGKTYVQKARGRDEFKHHDYVSRPAESMDKNNLLLRDIANTELQKILYNDAKKIGKY